MQIEDQIARLSEFMIAHGTEKAKGIADAIWGRENSLSPENKFRNWPDEERGAFMYALDYYEARRRVRSDDAISLTFNALCRAHIDRQHEWCPDEKPDIMFRAVELAGEVGEACNIVKKIERERKGWRGSRASKDDLASELADVIHCAFLLAWTAEIDLEAAVVAKFNETSKTQGLTTYLPDNDVPI